MRHTVLTASDPCVVNALQSSTWMFDVIVVGGGPAGLSAALMLGRCRRRVLVCDLGQPRNRRSHALHGFLTRDGVPPAELNALGRAELRAYGVEFRSVGVTSVTRADGHFNVCVGPDGEETTRFLLLATGVIDDLTPIPGVDDCYGRSLFHCPYCDGWEWRDRRLATIGRPAAAAGLALSLKTWSTDVVVCTNGAPIDRAARGRLERNAIEIRTDPIERLNHDDGLLRSIVFAGGAERACDAMFFSSRQHPQSPLAMSLGCTLNRSGVVNTGNQCETSVPGVFVAGDASRDAQFAIVAAAEGLKAAVAINKTIQQQELRP
jgi:thioredoxin reductase